MNQLILAFSYVVGNGELVFKTEWEAMSSSSTRGWKVGERLGSPSSESGVIWLETDMKADSGATESG